MGKLADFYQKKFRSTVWGFSAGLILAVMVATAVAMHDLFEVDKKWEDAQLAYQIVSVTLYSAALLGCLLGTYQ